MPKLKFTGHGNRIWAQIEGNKKIGLTSIRTEIFVDILGRELGLFPVVARYGDHWVAFDKQDFLGRHIRGQPDGWCQVFYHPDDCEKATGSHANNWTQWATRLLDYKRKDHRYAAKRRLPGASPNDSPTRLLSLEVVVFYLALQVRTWGNPARIQTVKDFIEKQDIPTKGIILEEPEIPMDKLFPDAQGSTATATQTAGTRLPKAAQALVSYNPTASALPGDAPEGEVDLLDGLFDADVPPPQTQSPTLDAMTDDELQAHLANVQKLLEKRKAERNRFRTEAEQGAIIPSASQVCSDRGEWASVQIRFPNGNIVVYVRASSGTSEES